MNFFFSGYFTGVMTTEVHMMRATWLLSTTVSAFFPMLRTLAELFRELSVSALLG